jgi:hypothetical protein
MDECRNFRAGAVQGFGTGLRCVECRLQCADAGGAEGNASLSQPVRILVHQNDVGAVLKQSTRRLYPDAAGTSVTTMRLPANSAITRPDKRGRASP